MKHHVNGSTALLVASMWVGVAACDSTAELDRKGSVEAQGAANVVVEHDATLEAEAKVDGAAGVSAEGSGEVAAVIEPASFDLEAVAGIVKQGEIESAAELEVIVNDEARAYNHIDIDADGKIDHVQVVEVKADGDAEAEVTGDVVLELRAIPSSKATVEAAVTFATVSFVRHPVNSEVEISAGFTAVVRQPEVHVYTHVVPVRIDAGVIVGGSVFLSWVYAVERPVYVGVYVVDDHGHWIPPGHLEHGHWKATGNVTTHGEVHEHGKVSGHGKGGGLFDVEIRGSTGVHFGGSGKASGSGKAGGSAKASTKHEGHSSGGKSKGGSKSKGGGKGKGK